MTHVHFTINSGGTTNAPTVSLVFDEGCSPVGLDRLTAPQTAELHVRQLPCWRTWITALVHARLAELQLVSLIFKNTVRTAKKTQHFTVTKINRLTLFILRNTPNDKCSENGC
jgi:hypothetical protein